MISATPTRVINIVADPCQLYRRYLALSSLVLPFTLKYPKERQERRCAEHKVPSPFQPPFPSCIQVFPKSVTALFYSRERSSIMLLWTHWQIPMFKIRYSLLGGFGDAWKAPRVSPYEMERDIISLILPSLLKNCTLSKNTIFLVLNKFKCHW